MFADQTLYHYFARTKIEGNYLFAVTRSAKQDAAVLRLTTAGLNLQILLLACWTLHQAVVNSVSAKMQVMGIPQKRLSWISKFGIRNLIICTSLLMTVKTKDSYTLDT